MCSLACGYLAFSFPLSLRKRVLSGQPIPLVMFPCFANIISPGHTRCYMIMIGRRSRKVNVWDVVITYPVEIKDILINMNYVKTITDVREKLIKLRETEVTDFQPQYLKRGKSKP